MPKAQIIDLGSGTGKFTELLVKRDEQYEIVAVEPHAEMRDELVKKGLGERVAVLDGDAGNILVEDGWGDALVAAQVSALRCVRRDWKEADASDLGISLVSTY